MTDWTGPGARLAPSLTGGVKVTALTGDGRIHLAAAAVTVRVSRAKRAGEKGINY
jgi:hypothetical protein